MFQVSSGAVDQPRAQAEQTRHTHHGGSGGRRRCVVSVLVRDWARWNRRVQVSAARTRAACDHWCNHKAATRTGVVANSVPPSISVSCYLAEPVILDTSNHNPKLGGLTGTLFDGGDRIRHNTGLWQRTVLGGHKLFLVADYIIKRAAFKMTVKIDDITMHVNAGQYDSIYDVTIETFNNYVISLTWFHHNPLSKEKAKRCQINVFLKVCLRPRGVLVRQSKVETCTSSRFMLQKASNSQIFKC